MVRTFFAFFVLYLLYMALVFVGMALLWKYAFEAGLSGSALAGVAGLALLVVLLGAPIVLYVRHAQAPTRWQQQLFQSGQQASARIVKVQDTGLSLGNSDLSFVVRLTLQVNPEGQPAFEAQIELPVSRVAIPQVGQQISVKYDAARPLRVVMVPEDAGRRPA